MALGIDGRGQAARRMFPAPMSPAVAGARSAPYRSCRGGPGVRRGVWCGFLLAGDLAGEAFDLTHDRYGLCAHDVEGVADRLLVGLVLGSADDALPGKSLQAGGEGDGVGAGQPLQLGESPGPVAEEVDDRQCRHVTEHAKSRQVLRRRGGLTTMRPRLTRRLTCRLIWRQRPQPWDARWPVLRGASRRPGRPGRPCAAGFSVSGRIRRPEPAGLLVSSGGYTMVQSRSLARSRSSLRALSANMSLAPLPMSFTAGPSRSGLAITPDSRMNRLTPVVLLAAITAVTASVIRLDFFEP